MKRLKPRSVCRRLPVGSPDRTLTLCDLNVCVSQGNTREFALNAAQRWIWGLWLRRLIPINIMMGFSHFLVVLYHYIKWRAPYKLVGSGGINPNCAFITLVLRRSRSWFIRKQSRGDCSTSFPLQNTAALNQQRPHHLLQQPEPRLHPQTSFRWNCKINAHLLMAAEILRTKLPYSFAQRFNISR